MPWNFCTENHYNHYDITHYLKGNGQFNTTWKSTQKFWGSRRSSNFYSWLFWHLLFHRDGVGWGVGVKQGNINPDWDLKVALYLINLRNKFNDVSLYLPVFLVRTIQYFTLVKIKLSSLRTYRCFKAWNLSTFRIASPLLGRKLTIQFQQTIFSP